MKQQDKQHAAATTWPHATGSSKVNVGKTERWASAVGGGLLALYGLSRFSLRGLLVAAGGGALLYRGLTGNSPAFGALGYSTARPQAQPRPATVITTLTVARPREAVYDFWRDLTNLPRFMQHLAQVRPIDDRYSDWTARVPGGMGTMSWRAELTEERAGEQLTWRSVPDADIDNAGTVTFRDAPGGGTEVHVAIAYRPPGGDLGTGTARLLTPAFEQMVKEDVRRFKHILEAGEIPTTEGQPAGADRA